MALGDSYPVELLDDQGNRVATEVAAVQFTDGADQPSRSGGGSNPGLFETPGSGSPTPDDQDITPTAPGYLYQDIQSGALWQASGATSADWVCIGGWQEGGSNGVALTDSTSASHGTTWAVTEGVTVGFIINSASSWGSTKPVTRTASNMLDDGEAGTATFAGGIIFPTADPHIAGAWWDDAGTLTKSAG